MKRKLNWFVGMAFVFLGEMSLAQTKVLSIPVEPHPNQLELLESEDAQLHRNKQLVFDFYRIVLRGLRLDRAQEFLAQNYIQHNPNVPTGLEGFVRYFREVFGDRQNPIPSELSNLVSIQAERDMVTLSFVWAVRGEDGDIDYTTTWFDMFRIQDGKIAEHWDNDIKR